MGLDLILGAIVLVMALRGWFRGFFAQAIRLGSFVGAAYVAGPIRDLARPVAADYLPSLSTGLLDRLLWWVAAVMAFVVIGGVANGLLASQRRRRASAEGGSGPGHGGDHSAGALLGAAKGAIVVAFLASGLQRYALDYLEAGGWVGSQVETSKVLGWSAAHQPARRIWESTPVRRFVEHVRTMGFDANRSQADGSDESAVLAVEPTTDPTAPDVRTFDPSPDRRRPRADDSIESGLDEVRRDLELLDAIRSPGRR